LAESANAGLISTRFQFPPRKSWREEGILKCVQNVFALRLCLRDDDGLCVTSHRRTHVICVRSAFAVSSICFADILYLLKIWCLQGCKGFGSYKAEDLQTVLQTPVCKSSVSERAGAFARSLKGRVKELHVRIREVGSSIRTATECKCWCQCGTLSLPRRPRRHSGKRIISVFQHCDVF
jgi:hypothetical protein